MKNLTDCLPTPVALTLAFTLFIAAAGSTHAAATAEQNHAHMLKQLGIDSIRRGADGDPNSPHAANYSEEKANEHLASLPALLEFPGGKIITSAIQWRDARATLLELFDDNLYGRTPTQIPAVSWQVQSTRQHSVAGREVETLALLGIVDNRLAPHVNVAMQLSVTRPLAVKTPVPVILQFSFDPEFMAKILSRFTDEQIRAFNGGDKPWEEQVTEKGWAYAELIATSVQADSGDGLREGIIGLVNKGNPRTPQDWGALKAWAWGAGRALDYFDSHPQLDATRVAIAGHSRFGKAALVTMAYDQRFAAGYISSSGEGGAKLWRRNFGEQIGNLAGSGEFHWMAGNFIRYAGPLTVDDLPVDAHQLIALCAPRPVFVGVGAVGEDWTDPKGMFMAVREASPVYPLLGQQGLSGQEFPAVDQGYLEGDIVFRRHSGGHTPGPNWRYFLAFADRYFSVASVAPVAPVAPVAGARAR